MAKPKPLFPICSKTFLNGNKLKAPALKVHPVKKAYKCNLCSKDFSNRSNLNVHVSSQHEGLRYAPKRNFECRLCGFEVFSGQDLINHMRKHTGERPFKCAVDGCSKAFKLELTLKNHIKYKHSDERPLKCKFPGCRFTAKTDVNLIGHMKVHSENRPFTCPNDGCSFRARERNQVERHLKSVHSEAKAFACSECDYKTNRSDILKSHMDRHTATRDFKCSHPDCTESFKSSFDLNRHLSNRHGERNVPCDQPGCGRKYANANALYKHKWAVHSKRSLACPHVDCDFSTNKPEKFAAHVTVHDGRKPKISCPIAGCQYKGKHTGAVKLHIRQHQVLLPCAESVCSRYKFTKTGLTEHAKLHNPLGRPFQCTLCFKHYTTQDKLVRHTTQHTKEKPFMCGHCDFGALDRSGIKRHIFAVHANLKFPCIVLPPDKLECLHCDESLVATEFFVHSVSHAVPVVMIERMEINCS